MNNKEIKYIGFYDSKLSSLKRYSALSAMSKMDYIMESLIAVGFKVNLIIPSWIDDNIFYYDRNDLKPIKQNIKHTLVPSFYTSNKILRIIKILFSLCWLFYTLLFTTKRNEKILVYHSPNLYYPIRFAQLLIGFKIVLEVEEIYSEVWKTSKFFTKKEYDLIKIANSYILASELLGDKLNDKKSIFLYGNYFIPDITLKKNKNENNYQLVYAGGIEFVRGGAFNAIKCIEYLPDKYTMNILGFGEEKTIVKLNEEISLMNNKLGRIACIYHGSKSGKDFEELMSNFSIGLNPQFEGGYMDFAFPSKILMYLSFNLRVVSSNINSIKKSKISNLIVFSENDSPKALANAIISINFKSNNNSIDTIKNLDNLFREDISNVFYN